MSRQVRTQMPQTQKKDKRSKSKGKKFDKNTCLLVFVLIFSGILIFLLLYSLKLHIRFFHKNFVLNML